MKRSQSTAGRTTRRVAAHATGSLLRPPRQGRSLCATSHDTPTYHEVEVRFFHPNGPSLQELATQALSSVESEIERANQTAGGIKDELEKANATAKGAAGDIKGEIGGVRSSLRHLCDEASAARNDLRSSTTAQIAGVVVPPIASLASNLLTSAILAAMTMAPAQQQPVPPPAQGVVAPPANPPDYEEIMAENNP